jgi:hypothetical protein
MAAVTSYLNHVAFSTVALSSPFPDLPHDPFIAALRVPRADLALRWSDARRAIVFPKAPTSLLIAPASTPLHPYLAERLDVRLVERIYTRPDDVDPYFDVFAWEPVAAFDHLVRKTAAPPSPDLPANFGAVELVAYDVLSPPITSGETIILITFWRVLDPAMLGPVSPQAYGHSAVIFAHLLSAASTIAGQEDRLDAPAWNWQRGDAFVQIHQITTEAGLAPGRYRIEIGLYTQPDMRRLPAFVGGQAVGDYILLPPVQVKQP